MTHISAETLSFLLKFHGDHELGVGMIDRDECDTLTEAGLIEPTKRVLDRQYYRITPPGFRITSTAQGAANRELQKCSPSESPTPEPTT